MANAVKLENNKTVNYVKNKYITNNIPDKDLKNLVNSLNNEIENLKKENQNKDKKISTLEEKISILSNDKYLSEYQKDFINKIYHEGKLKLFPYEYGKKRNEIPFLEIEDLLNNKKLIKFVTLDEDDFDESYSNLKNKLEKKSWNTQIKLNHENSYIIRKNINTNEKKRKLKFSKFKKGKKDLSNNNNNKNY